MLLTGSLVLGRLRCSRSARTACRINNNKNQLKIFTKSGDPWISYSLASSGHMDFFVGSHSGHCSQFFFGSDLS